MNRRYFVLAAGGAGLAFAQGANDRVATAIIGTGNRGSYLLRGVLQQSNAKVVALCDNKPERLDRAATTAAKDNPKTYKDWRAVLDDKAVEAVYIATPPYLHSEMAIAALNAGKHVYCEKPIGITPEQVQKLVKAARASKKVFTAGQQRRSDQRLAEAVGKIHSGALGAVIMVKAQRHAPADLRHDGSSGDWFFDVTKSGGYLVEQSVHNLDVCNWTIGNHPVRATGFGGIGRYKNDPPGRTIFDFGSITYEYPGGVMMSFTQNVLHPKGLPSGGQYTLVYGTTAAADLDSMAVVPLDPATKPSTLAEARDERETGHMAAFYDAITKGTKSPADIKIGAEAALTAIMGHEAMTNRRVVEWSSFGVDL